MNEQFKFYEHLITSDIKTALLKLNITSLSSLWDLVVITAISDSQKACYENNINRKIRKKQLPIEFKYLVLNDPPNSKIGCGGSTLNVIKFLYDLYSEDLFYMKILLIHAGGYSQRIPFNTVIGKIFAPVPCESSYINDMFDIKLAIYTPFAIYMKPGIFLAASDDIISSKITEQIEAGKSFGSNDTEFSLLAHKSSLIVGKDHGIYAVHEDSVSNSYKLHNCKFVLQKPSIEKMRVSKIILNDEADNEYVYSDSSFYFSHAITKELRTFQQDHLADIISMNIEIDAYRDFLQPLGTEQINLNDYLASAKSDLSIFKDLYKSMSHRKSVIVALSDSYFFHLGTIHELFDFYINQSSPETEKFQKSICFTRLKFNNENILDLSSIASCVYYSKLSNQCILSPNSIIEYCYIDEGVTVELGDYSYLNNCSLRLSELENKCVFKIPANICMHTVSIIDSDSGRNKYVTIFFGRNDELKKTYSCVEEIVFLGKVLSGELIGSMLKPERNSIWDMQVFQGADTMSESFELAQTFVEHYLNDGSVDMRAENSNTRVYCLFDLLRVQNYADMIKFREENNFF